MKQSEFYRCMGCGETFYALCTLGYVEGGIGLIKETKERGWVATHIPTGARITPDLSKHRTANQALLEAEHLISESDSILKYIEKVKSSKGYTDFLADRHRQLREKDFNEQRRLGNAYKFI